MNKHSRRFRQFAIGGDLKVNRLGSGAMRITARNLGEPETAAKPSARYAGCPNLTWIYRQPSWAHVSEKLIHEALFPIRLVIATKSDLSGPAPTNGFRTDALNSCAMALRQACRLGAERIDLWQLHRIDLRPPRDEHPARSAKCSKGLIRHIGLSQVSVEEIKAAKRSKWRRNLYNLADRSSETFSLLRG